MVNFKRSSRSSLLRILNSVVNVIYDIWKWSHVYSLPHFFYQKWPYKCDQRAVRFLQLRSYPFDFRYHCLQDVSDVDNIIVILLAIIKYWSGHYVLKTFNELVNEPGPDSICNTEIFSNTLATLLNFHFINTNTLYCIQIIEKEKGITVQSSRDELFT